MNQKYTIEISFWKLLKVNYFVHQKHNFKVVHLLSFLTLYLHGRLKQALPLPLK